MAKLEEDTSPEYITDFIPTPANFNISNMNGTLAKNLLQGGAAAVVASGAGGNIAGAVDGAVEQVKSDHRRLKEALLRFQDAGAPAPRERRETESRAASESERELRGRHGSKAAKSMLDKLAHSGDLWTTWQGFLYVLGTICGLGTPLSDLVCPCGMGGVWVWVCSCGYG